MNPTLPAPADFADHYQDRIEDIRLRYRVTTATIHRWLSECGLTRASLVKGPADKPAPEGYADFAAVETVRALMERYGVSRHVIRRWDAEVGRTRARFEQVRVSAKAKGTASIHKIGNTRTPFEQAHRDHSQAGQAADYLRRLGPVVRCDADGAYDPRGDFYRRGSTVLTPDELVDRAVRNGWDPNAWKRVA